MAEEGALPTLAKTKFGDAVLPSLAKPSLAKTSPSLAKPSLANTTCSFLWSVGETVRVGGGPLRGREGGGLRRRSAAKVRPQMGLPRRVGSPEGQGPSGGPSGVAPEGRGPRRGGGPKVLASPATFFFLPSLGSRQGLSLSLKDH